ncbi:MarR family winged helix-turn-helix transcriptional regulator [Mucilaginibacter sp. RS28]|uniref:MarR family winged helix-turn-helix transcriptional regulator n=1 Tax=Mucilaginibacter straminoryzae TaxID=2932774 RepID=A0A9X1X5L8_9SPHI|nr:MarR family winged helix-turn-helix transcriptional regulator [Mucilaginibacter straminoryzae]MCJ8211479.1 MarR family winged helix-turn-helix transcriptional regulator [Mucilaginibacter straminoryzae]
MDYNNADFKGKQENNIFRILYIFKRSLDEWGEKNVNTLREPEFHITYMPFFMNIDVSGISNNELAARMGVTKQGASRIVKGLISCGLVTAKKSKTDRRSSMLYLTEKGKQFQADAINKFDGLINGYIEMAGEKKYKTTIETLLKLIAYHDIHNH